ncbi:hypothetical protein RSAG8_13853, partial [Rhizoctonia solani AG-8 WAC10335]
MTEIVMSMSAHSGGPHPHGRELIHKTKPVAKPNDTTAYKHRPKSAPTGPETHLTLPANPSAGGVLP